ncbi:hypothetical protein D9615_006812 [Tricholomella constricta]|uniref:GST N-terminal domain-containing protein n=1 Tax=Tricholomella constricta TaxID=117010 RepID=A0A8H5M239_9AGAR|nr:hypothetical protein D9615_006812 [Tricholomella constricta]
MSNSTIKFYDITVAPAILGKGSSPNTLKTRMCLNYKGIPYQTVWVEYPDIEAVCKEIGALPTGNLNASWGPYYTLPAIHDPSTGTILAESALITEYLDDTYPDTPKLFPPGTRALQLAFIDAFMSKLGSMWQFILPLGYPYLSPRSQEFYRKTREAWFGKKLEDIVPTGQKREEEWAKVKVGFDAIDTWFKKANTEGGPYLLGANIAFADIVVASFLLFFRQILGEVSPEWTDINAWSEGRWEAYLQRFESFKIIT